MSLGSIGERILPKSVFRTLSREYMKWKYRGTRLKCPMCEHSFEHFLPGGFNFPVLQELDVVGAGFREEVRCPHCDSNDRERLVYLFLRSHTRLYTDGGSILHVAPEKSLQLFLKKIPRINHISVDINSPQADQSMDIRKIVYPDGKFDVVICNHVLEHIPEDGVAMRELFRVLKPRGFAILQVPIANNLSKTVEDPSITDPRERERLFGQYDHVRIYSDKDYTRRLETAGFSVERIPATVIADASEIQNFSLNPREVLYFCRKV